MIPAPRSSVALARRVATVLVSAGIALAPISAGAQQVDLVPRCLDCADAKDSAAVSLLLRADARAGVTLAWDSAADPRGTPLTLYAGNPADQATIPRRVVFGPESWKQTPEGPWRATFSFRGEELGSGTFLTVLVAPGKDVERIRDWRAWRLLTLAENAALPQPPARPPGTSVRITPWLLQVDTGHGLLPPRRGSELAWFSVVPLEGNVTDVDLDGANTGVPGLGIQVAEPWHTTAGEKWHDKLKTFVTGNPGHKVRFEDFEWIEQPDRTLEVPGAKIYLRNYYSVITVYTRATHRRYSEKEAGGHRLIGNPDYFAHETTARLKPPDGPLLWASYDERVHGRDPYLLRLLQIHGRNGWGVPGLPQLQPVDGDGEKARYTIGFHTEVAPWSEPQAGTGKFTAGIVGMDVVAARAGIGAISAQDGTEDGGPWCAVIGCGGGGGKGIDLHSPPTGYSVSSPVALLGTLSGALQVTDKPPEHVVPRGVEPADAPTAQPVPASAAAPKLPTLPREVRFGLTADLRAGLLRRDAFFGPPKDVWEINPYAQYVVRITVAMLPETAMVVSDVPIIPKKSEHSTVFVLVQSWWQKLADWLWSYRLFGLLLLGLGVVVAASLALPTVPLLAAIARLARAVGAAVKRAVEWLADRIGGKGK